MEKEGALSRSRAEQTKDKLFEAAVALLAQREFEQITIRDIVEKAEVSIGTFYNYYTTKMEVFYETYRVADSYFEETVAPMLTQSTTGEKVACFFQQYARYCSELTDMKMTRLLYNPDNQWFNRDSSQGMVGILTGVLQEGLDRGELTGGDAAGEIASYLMISIRGLVYHWCTTNNAYDLKQATARFVERLMRAYLPG